MAEEKIVYSPMIALRQRVALPCALIVFDVARQTSYNAVKVAAASGDLLIAFAQKDGKLEQVTEGDIYTVGTCLKIEKVVGMPNNCARVTARGVKRVKLKSVKSDGSCLYATAEEYDEVSEDLQTEEAYLRACKYAIDDVLSTFSSRYAVDELRSLLNVADCKEFVYRAAMSFKLPVAKAQAILEETIVAKKASLLFANLTEELQIARLEKKIASTVRQNIEEGQKHFYLREQLKVIHSELGDDESELDELKEKIAEKNLPAEIEEKALKEIKRMSKMQTSSPDYNVLRGYIDWILDLEWNKQTQDTQELADAVEVLNNDHYGLEKIKERITEYLAVLQLTKGMNAPILCLVGPPGVGKTSIASSVARALGRKFVRMSLGGVRDESEIRGHRRTYVGAMPGRIIAAIKNAGSINPVFLLDEVDKLSSDPLHGDPSSALLEVLDPAQNSTFRDRYLEVPYDLSKVLFITTANDMSTIPAPLRDRMEIIEISGYTEEEKREIAKRYLVPKKVAANGLEENSVTFTDDGLNAVISGYTREAGVRSLERNIDAVCRKIAVSRANGDGGEVVVTKQNIADFLGAEKYSLGDGALKEDTVGAACGLAWTAVGGTTLTVEASAMTGSGEVLLTGKLGDVMKESARAAISYIRSNAQVYGLEDGVFKSTDIHVHVPEGATPKDGPSAGITMATAILSAFTHKPVRSDVAMTGEITLRGRVLPIGGLKEKSLAAYRVGVRKVIIPKDNLKDLEEVPPSVKDSVTFIPVETVGQVFQTAIVGI